ncbi:putative transposase [Parabacteroides sp. PF5-5]|uniref:transposase n=1 Tax=unclassified Parabacteroides TaxID=2649774 RepID=UPI002474ECB4|nr:MULTISPECIES: transposase [unclassified Parabacteroides]MDH6303949.1 putative transposase [Parabacteroides sp. PH5-39]MDH6314565.1 putative transposase [Parabacteroides sp. PF5-13]MDH6318370.1 putative transposase [Parabacteroides sp. PH5-13]MDH6322338.1 putative transposase [Parabacteroides sp. PH5-8]MDH6325583.1 putative transposase [Parabacteroides sp. PH5-41]
MSYNQSVYHIIIRTKYSRRAISPEYAPKLYAYIWGIIKNLNGVLYRINGIEDHIHIVSSLPATIALADYIRNIKSSSSSWMKKSNFFPEFVGWGKEYCSLTYSYRDKQSIIDYVKNQQVHHRKLSFKEEIYALFEETGVELDERFFLN